MTYILEEISPEIQEKILSDANCDERKKRQLLGREGHFNNNPGLNWVVDREQDSYLFKAPKIDPREPRFDFFFYYKASFYRIYFANLHKYIVYFEDFVSTDGLKVKLETELQKAFNVYRNHKRGLSPYPDFSIVFEGEWNVN